MANGPCELRSSLLAIFRALAFITFLAMSWSASAERSTFATYGFEQGLSSVEGSSLAQDRAGDILVSSEHGVFAYDGRRFVNLGPEQGLPSGGEVYSIVLASAGRVAVQYPGEIYISDEPSTSSRPVSSLHFHPLSHPGITLYAERPHQVVAWGSGFVFLAGEATIRIVVPPVGQARVESMSYDQEEQAALKGATALFMEAGHLWETFEDDRICNADLGAVRCYAAADGLAQEPWVDLVENGSGQVMARSAFHVASFDPRTCRWSSSALPDQGGRYEADHSNLGLYRTPDGKLITQSIQGLDVLDARGWTELTVAEGAPAGTIVSAMTDGAGQLWFHVLGRGLVRWVGYGHWDAVERADGLSDGYPWQTARSDDGSLWVTTDDGVDKVIGQGASRHVSQVFPMSSYALAVTPRGDVWASYSNKGVRVINPVSGSMVVIAMPAVGTIVPVSHHIWIGTTAGLYAVDDNAGPPYQPVPVEASKAPINSIKPDGQGGIYYLYGYALHHLHRDNTDIALKTPFPNSFEPRSMTFGPDGALWVGGGGGLFRLTLRDDHVLSSTSVSTEDIPSNSVIALMTDHRGWIWVGTDQGVSVYDGQRWATTDASQGLLSNDINEDGLREDPDGSVWMTTSRGVAHLRDPASLFAYHPLTITIPDARIGTRPVAAGEIPYNHDPLTVELATPNFGERPISFQYRLSAVDGGWVSSSSGKIRYPFVPPGHHVLTVLATDLLTHRQSQATDLVIDVAFPWWRQWWAEGLWSTCVLIVLYGGMRFRYRAMYLRQATLRRHIAEATAHIRHQAAHDQLTGLLIRSEVERRLAERLARGNAKQQLVIALLDVDHFKRINDSYGHLGGDEVLRSLGSIIRRSLRDDEFAGRYGGEEILIVLDDGDEFAAERVLNLHLAIRHDTFKAGRNPIAVTCSIGVAWASKGDNWETLIGRADAALYDAKNAGRDRVVESRSHDAPQPGSVTVTSKPHGTMH